MVNGCARPATGRVLFGTGPAAEWLEIHPQTLRRYERMGLVDPMRRNGRRYFTATQLRHLERVMQEAYRARGSLTAAAARIG
ncbi:MAG TPA: MerR family transcriptional regulator [Verrucomicrobiae bacterium]|nr:MerR family transcriptional regulator [Verrucomicrobiae bacterium]